LKERGRMRSQNEGKHPDTATLASLRLFLLDRERERVQLHRSFMRYWQSLTRVKIWDELQETLTAGRKMRFVPVQKYDEAQIRTACETVSATGPDGLRHHCTVTRLALTLFDSLRPMHGMTPQDRTLLEWAGLLRNIGKQDGAKHHRAHSARRIFSDESLPFDLSDRSAVGLIVLAHRGQVTIESHPLFALLSHNYRKKVLQLAAILRIADGLDVLHTGSVQEIRCTVGDHECTCDIIASGDVTTEKEKARSRSGLFVRVFERELVIR